jgi:putative membrane protein
MVSDVSNYSHVMSESPSGWAARLLSTGSDPDARFSLANEGVATFVSTQMAKGVSILVAAGLVLLGALTCVAAWFRWLRVERAMRQAQGIPPSRLAPLLAFGIALLAILSVIGVVLAQ